MKNTLEHEIWDLERRLEAKKNELNNIHKNCRHIWGATIPDHIYHPAYTIPGDEPGTMGVDWRGPYHVEAKTEKRWKQECKVCGKIEYTNNTNKITIEEPKF